MKNKKYKDYKCHTCLQFLLCEKLSKATEEEKEKLKKTGEENFFGLRFSVGEKYTCEDYEYKYIEYPLEINSIKNMTIALLESKRVNFELVKIRLASDDRTYLGILLGNLPYQAFVNFNKQSKELEVAELTNPAIFVPELKRIIYGMESWWSKIESEDDLEDITDEIINNTWYVKALSCMGKGGLD